MTVQAEGVPQGEATILNFVGANVSAAVAGGVATVTVNAGADLSAQPFLIFGPANATLTGEFNVRSDVATQLTNGFDVKFKWNEGVAHVFDIENLDLSGAVDLRLLSGASGESAIELDNTVNKMILTHLQLGLGLSGASSDTVMSRSAANTFLVAAGDLMRFGGGARLDASQTLRFRNPANTFQSTFVAGAQGLDLDYTWPITAPTAGDALVSTAAGVLSWDTPAAQYGISDDAFVIAMAVAL
jgi:hypothetical protein